ADHTTTFTYDKLGRSKTETTQDGTLAMFYDPATAIGALDYTTFTDSNSAYYHRQQNSYRSSDSKLLSATTTIRVPGFSTRTYTQSQTYDSYGRIKTTTSPSGYYTENHYQSST